MMKRKYINEGIYQACIINLLDLKDVDILNNTWYKIKQWYEFFDKRALLSIDELRKEFDLTEDSIVRFGIKRRPADASVSAFFIAKKYKINIDTDDLVNVLIQIYKHFI